MSELLLTTPALAALRAAMPAAEITLALDASCRELLPALPFVDRKLIYDRRKGNAATWSQLFLRPFDVCLDFTGTDRSALFSMLSKANRRIAFQGVDRSRWRPLFYNALVDSAARKSHLSDHYARLLEPLKIATPAELAPVLELPAWAERKAEQWLGESPMGGRFALLQPGTDRREKFWEPDRWAAVVTYLRERWGMTSVIAGGGLTQESQHIARIGAAAGVPFRDLSGKLDFLTLAALARKAGVVLSVDAPAMHLAAAFGTPQVALFGPSDPLHYGPRHGRAAVLRAGGEAEDSARPGRAPMSMISTEAVIRATGDVLRSETPEP